MIGEPILPMKNLPKCFKNMGYTIGLQHHTILKQWANQDHKLGIKENFGAIGWEQQERVVRETL